MYNLKWRPISTKIRNKIPTDSHYRCETSGFLTKLAEYSDVIGQLKTFWILKVVSSSGAAVPEGRAHNCMRYFLNPLKRVKYCNQEEG